MYVKTFILGLGFISVPARISKGHGAGPEKGHFLACCWIFKKGSFRDTVKSNKVYNQILTFIICT